MRRVCRGAHFAKQLSAPFHAAANEHHPVPRAAARPPPRRKWFSDVPSTCQATDAGGSTGEVTIRYGQARKGMHVKVGDGVLILSKVVVEAARSRRRWRGDVVQLLGVDSATKAPRKMAFRPAHRPLVCTRGAELADDHDCARLTSRDGVAGAVQTLFSRSESPDAGALRDLLRGVPEDLVVHFYTRAFRSCRERRDCAGVGVDLLEALPNLQPSRHFNSSRTAGLLGEMLLFAMEAQAAPLALAVFFDLDTAHTAWYVRQCAESRGGNRYGGKPKSLKLPTWCFNLAVRAASGEYHTGQLEAGALERLLGLLEARRVNPNRWSFTSLINTVGSAGLVDCGHSLLRSMQEHDFEPSARDFQILINVSVAKKAMGPAMALIREANSSPKLRGKIDLRPFQSLVRSIIKSCRSAQSCLRILDTIRDAGVQPDATIYCAILKALLRYGGARAAFGIHEEMRLLGMEPDKETIVKLIGQLGRMQTMLPSALQLMSRADDVGVTVATSASPAESALDLRHFPCDFGRVAMLRFLSQIQAGASGVAGAVGTEVEGQCPPRISIRLPTCSRCEQSSQGAGRPVCHEITGSLSADFIPPILWHSTGECGEVLLAASSAGGVCEGTTKRKPTKRQSPKSVYGFL